MLKFGVNWASIAAEESPSGATLQAEGTQTITWAASDNDVYKVSDVTLDGDTVVAGEMIALDLTFEDTGTTLAVASTHYATILWE